jgi:hypothetical protein
MPGRGAEQVPGSLFGDTRTGEAGGDEGSVARERPDDERSPQEDQEPPAEQPAPETGEPTDRERAARDVEPPAPPPGIASNGDHTTTGPVGTLSTVPGRRRPARYGLLVQFESRPDEVELGRLVDSTIWINDAHPAYVRAAASRSTGYHLALSVALALAPLAVESAEEHAFVTQFLAHWGAGSGGRRPRRRSRR